MSFLLNMLIRSGIDMFLFQYKSYNIVFILLNSVYTFSEPRADASNPKSFTNTLNVFLCL